MLEVEDVSGWDGRVGGGEEQVVDAVVVVVVVVTTEVDLGSWDGDVDTGVVTVVVVTDGDGLDITDRVVLLSGSFLVGMGKLASTLFAPYPPIMPDLGELEDFLMYGEYPCGVR